MEQHGKEEDMRTEDQGHSVDDFWKRERVAVSEVSTGTDGSIGKD
jgi:hypothetical protein